MAKLQRKSAKVFAEQASAGIGGIAQFGSLAAGNPNYSKDVDIIQQLDAYKEGWTSAVLGNKSPALEDRNALDYLLSYQQAYIMQHGLPEWLSTETYYENCYVVDSNGELRISLIDDNTGNNPVDDNGGQQYWGYAGARGSGKQIGEIYFSQSSSATDNKGALPLFTGETIYNAEETYPQFYAWVKTHTNLQISAANYESALTTYGECPKYVIDDVAKTIRLPKLVNYIKMANAGQGITQQNAGLPNITGSIDGSGMAASNQAFGEMYSPSITGAFEGIYGYQNNTSDQDGGNMLRGVSFNASRSNSIYGASDTVTPKHTTLFPWVFAFNSAIPASTAQAAEFLQAVSDLQQTTYQRVFTPLDVTIANGDAGIAGAYTITQLPDDNKIRLALFQASLVTSQAGYSSMNLVTDVSTTPAVVCGTNNGHATNSAILLPIKRSVSINFPSTTGGIVSGTSLKILGYF